VLTAPKEIPQIKPAATAAQLFAELTNIIIPQVNV